MRFILFVGSILFLSSSFAATNGTKVLNCFKELKEVVGTTTSDILVSKDGNTLFLKRNDLNGGKGNKLPGIIIATKDGFKQCPLNFGGKKDFRFSFSSKSGTEEISSGSGGDLISKIDETICVGSPSARQLYSNVLAAEGAKYANANEMGLRYVNQDPKSEKDKKRASDNEAKNKKAVRTKFKACEQVDHFYNNVYDGFATSGTGQKQKEEEEANSNVQ